MKIENEYSPGEIVWTIHENEIISGRVKSVQLSGILTKDGESAHIGYVIANPLPNGPMLQRLQSNIFYSRQDLITSL